MGSVNVPNCDFFAENGAEERRGPRRTCREERAEKDFAGREGRAVGGSFWLRPRIVRKTGDVLTPPPILLVEQLLKPEGDAILDFTGCMEPPSGTSKNLIISPEDEKAHITVRGTSGVSYGFLHLSVSSNIAGLMLQDFRTESSLFLDYDEDACEIVYDGECAINQRRRARRAA